MGVEKEVHTMPLMFMNTGSIKEKAGWGFTMNLRTRAWDIGYMGGLPFDYGYMLQKHCCFLVALSADLLHVVKFT